MEIGIGIGMGQPARPLLPTDLPGGNLKFWVTAQAGTPVAGINLLGSWTVSNLTRTSGQTDPFGGTGAFKYTDSTDGAPTTHTTSATVTNAFDGPHSNRIWAKADTGCDQIQIQSGSTSTVAVRFTFSTQTFSDLQNCTASIVQTIGSWYQLEILPTTVAHTPVFVVYLSVGGTSSYQGAANKSFQLYSPTLTQDSPALTQASCSNDTAATWTIVSGSLTRTLSQTDPGGGTSAIKLTDIVDGAPAGHSLIQTPAVNTQAGPHIFQIWVNQGTKTWCMIQLDATSNLYVNLATGAFGAQGGNVIDKQIVQSLGTWRLIELRATTTGLASPRVFPANGDGLVNYQGDGTGTFFVGTGPTYGPTLQQARITSLADQSGNGLHVAQGQATAGLQPQYMSIPGGTINGRVAMRFDDTNDTLAPISGHDGADWIFAHDGTGFTILALVYPTANGAFCATTATGGAGFLMTSNGTGGGTFQVWNATPALVIVINDATHITLNAAHSIVFRYATADTPDATAWVDGVSVGTANESVSPSGGNARTGLYLGATEGTSNLLGGLIGEVFACNRSLTLAEIRDAENGLRRRWGMAPL